MKLRSRSLAAIELGVMQSRFVPVLFALALAGFVSAAPPVCDSPGTDGCLPTPEQCSTGAYNGYWDGGSSGRFAVCAGGAGHVAHYTGGDANIPCGAIIAGDQMVAGNWTDPNVCPRPTDVPPPPGGAGRAFREGASSTKGAVASPSAQASRVGIDVLGAGGNAMDAAVATVFALAVARPDLATIGGQGWLLYRTAAGEAAVLGFEAVFPAAANAATFDQGGLQAMGIGHRTVPVPGVVAGMAAALVRFGTKPLGELIAPAEHLAREGITVTGHLANGYLFGPPLYELSPIPVPLDITAPFEPFPGKERISYLRLFPASAEIYLQGGVGQYPAGATLVQRDQAEALRLVREEGPEVFYTGRIAELIVEEMARPTIYPGDQGLLTMEDFASYKPQWREALAGTYRDYEVLVPPPSTGGGIAILEVLNILEGFDLASFGHSSANHLHVLAEAQKIAFADGYAYVGDPDFVSVPTAELVSKAYAAERRAEIDMTRAKSYAPGNIHGMSASAIGSPPKIAAHLTAHIAVVDHAGNAASVTFTVGESFGSAVVAPGTGFLLSDNLEAEPLGSPGEPAPGKRSRSAVSPAIVLRDGKPLLVTGAAGALLIPMGIVQTISNVVDFGMDAAHAVDAARVQEFSCCDMLLEDWRVPNDVESELAERGHSIVPLGEYYPAPQVQGVAIEPATGMRFAASDPRNEWGAAAEP